MEKRALLKEQCAKADKDYEDGYAKILSRKNRSRKKKVKYTELFAAKGLSGTTLGVIWDYLC